MYLLKQLQNANAKCMGGVVNQLRNLNRTGVCSLQFDRCMSCNITKSHTSKFRNYIKKYLNLLLNYLLLNFQIMECQRLK